MSEDEALALQLHFEEVELLRASLESSSERPQAQPDHDEAAPQDYQHQLKMAQQQASDARIAHKLAEAMEADSALLRKHIVDEARATLDEDLARRLAEQEDSEDDAPKDKAGLEDGDQNACVCCGDEEDSTSLVEAPCRHVYCNDCLKELFLKATKDESLFPPRCCRQNIPIDAISNSLSTEELHRFRIASIEFNTTNRIYCANPRCGIFILPENVQADLARCQECGNFTCTICKQVKHEGDCPQDTAVQETIALADRENWRRCSNCQRMVELHVGCNHIT